MSVKLLAAVLLLIVIVVAVNAMLTTAQQPKLTVVQGTGGSAGFAGLVANAGKALGKTPQAKAGA